jgi:hypothetical protein
MISEFLSPVSTADPTIALVAASIFIIGAAVVALYQRFNAANQRAINDQIAGAIVEFSRRNKELENQLCVTRNQLAVCERDRASLQTRCELLELDRSGPGSSPTRNDPA